MSMLNPHLKQNVSPGEEFFSWKEKNPFFDSRAWSQLSPTQLASKVFLRDM
eukprot:jgi/Antlo1/317/657